MDTEQEAVKGCPSVLAMKGHECPYSIENTGFYQNAVWTMNVELSWNKCAGSVRKHFGLKNFSGPAQNSFSTCSRFNLLRDLNTAASESNIH